MHFASNFMSFILLLCSHLLLHIASMEYILSHTHECEAIHWSTENLQVAITTKKNDSSFPTHYQLLFSSGRGFMSYSFHPHWKFEWLNFMEATMAARRAWVGSHVVSGRHHVTTLPVFLPLLLSFCPTSMTFPEPWVGLYGCPVWGWVHTSPYFQHFDQLSISTIIIAYCKRKLLWSMVIDTNV